MVKTTGPIKFRTGYKYQLAEDWRVLTELIGQACRVDGFIELSQDGWLTVKASYSWDGASGPTLDCHAYRGSLAHDALYQLMRAGKLPQSTRAYADKLMMQICELDGMSWLRRKYWHFALRKFAGHAAERQPEKIKTAP